MKKVFLLILIIPLIFTMGTTAWGQNLEGPNTEYDLALYIGSPLTISNNTIAPLDSTNPNVAPIIYMNRTLVPLRAISEHFGAIVSYDKEKSAAIIDYDNITYTFFSGKNYYTRKAGNLTTTTIYFDTNMLIKENRSMVPLRVICENILGKRVEYSKGIIVISEEAVGLSTNIKLLGEIKTKIGQAIKLSSISQLEKFLEAKTIDYRKNIMPSVDFEQVDGLASQDSASESASDFSSTNIQVSGVDESDVVKTDGRFIYIADGAGVRIIKATSGKMSQVEKIETQSKGIYISDIYIDEERLIILGSTQNGFTYCGIYSISSEGNSTLLKEVSIEGSMISSRKTSDTLYLVSNKYLYTYNPLQRSDVLPLYIDSAVWSKTLKNIGIKGIYLLHKRISASLIAKKHLSPNFILMEQK